MGRSRSSFEVTGAVATATALAPEAEGRKKKEPAGPEGPLVSFGGASAPERRPSSPPSSSAALIAMQSELPPSSTAEMVGGVGLRSALPPSATGEALEAGGFGGRGGTRDGAAYAELRMTMAKLPPYPALGQREREREREQGRERMRSRTRSRLRRAGIGRRRSCRT